MKIGSLFSGIGGIELGLERAGGGHTVWQCEQDTAAQAVLRRHWPGVPAYDDVCKIGAANVEPVDILCGGFPCQDISLAGLGAGLSGARSGLWFEFLRLIRELRPRFVVAENVAALVTRGLDVVLGGLAASGYDALWLALRAADVGAPHRRERVFIVAWRVADANGRDDARRGDDAQWHARGRVTAERAGGSVGYPNGARLALGQGQRGDARKECAATVGAGRENLADTDRDGLSSQRFGGLLDGQRTVRGDDAHGCRRQAEVGGHEWPPLAGDSEGWLDYIERHPGRAPAVGGKLNPGFVEALMGFPDGWTDGAKRNERLKMLGNAVVPQCAEVIGHVLLGLQDRGF